MRYRKKSEKLALDRKRNTQRKEAGVYKVLDFIARSTRSLLSDRGNICKERDYVILRVKENVAVRVRVEMGVEL